MADEGRPEEQVQKAHKVLRHLPFLVKIFEVILAVFAIGLIVDPMNSFQRMFNKPRLKLDDAAIIYVTVAGYIMINMILLTSHVLGDRVPKRTLILFASVGAFLHVVAGSVIVYNWRKIYGPYYYNNELYPSKQYMDMFLSGAVFTFVTAVAFILEIVLTIRYSTKTVR